MKIAGDRAGTGQWLLLPFGGLGKDTAWRMDLPKPARAIIEASRWASGGHRSAAQVTYFHESVGVVQISTS